MADPTGPTLAEMVERLRGDARYLEKMPDWRRGDARALVKGAFLDAARTHAPEWGPLIEADDDVPRP